MEMTDKRMTTEEKKAHKAEYDRARRMRNLKEAKESASAYYQKNKAAIAEKAAVRYRADTERHKERQEKWRSENKSRVNAAAAEWRRRNTEKVMTAARKWRAENRDIACAATSDWAKRNREKLNERSRKDRAENPARHRGYVHKRRALTSGGSISPGLASFLMEKQRGRCACCRQKLKSFHMDHIEPLSKGGEHADSNIQLLCPTCNHTKSNKDPVKFMQSMGWLI